MLSLQTMALLIYQLVAILLSIFFSTHCHCARPPDWMVTKVTKPTRLFHLPENQISLDNSLIRRTFITQPGFATFDYFSYEKSSNVLRAMSPEAIITLDGFRYNVGGVLCQAPRAYWNKTAIEQTMTTDPNAFHFYSYSTRVPDVLFPYKPMRGAPKDIAWPPKGLGIDVHFTPPKNAPVAHQMVRVIIHYEMYDGIPLMRKWLSVEGGASDVMVGVPSVEILAVNQQWSEDPTTPKKLKDSYGWLLIETDEPHGTSLDWGIDSHQSTMPGSYEPVVNCSYNPQPSVDISQGFVSFKVHELFIGSSDPERRNLAHKRMFRLLAPHTQENPIFFHLVNATSSAMRFAVDQLAEVGFEMLIYSFGSGVDIESTDPEYIAKIAADVGYARSKNIEVGSYDLIVWSRTVKQSWMAKKNETLNAGGACIASGWYDFLLHQVETFYRKTGMTVIATDGPYPGYSCNSTDHSHHRGLEDSVYWQEKLQGQFFTELRKNNFYINQPDRYFYKGGNRDSKYL